MQEASWGRCVSHRLVLSTLLLLALGVSTARSQVIFTGAADFNGQTGSGLFQEQNGQVTRLNTGFAEHNFPAVSRDSRFVIFSSPDGVTAPLQVPPSSDIYAYDRVLGQTRRLIDHTTLIPAPNEVQTFRPMSAALSANNQILAYGVELTRREGTANPQSTRELNIVSAATGVLISNPTFGRGPVPDSLMGEFTGLSWDPGNASFVTPVYVTIQSQNGAATTLPAITRVRRNANNGTWNLAEVLSTPQYLNLSFPPSAVTQIYPAISPSGTRLAYFQLFFPDVLAGTQGVFASLVTANADGSGAQTIANFNQGFYPVGLSWSRDETQLVFSIAQQLQTSTGFFPAAVASSAVVRQVARSGGAIGSIPGIASGLFPSVPAVPLLSPVVTTPTDSSPPKLRVRGRRKIQTRRSKVTLRGTTTTSSQIERLAVKARGAKVRKAQVLSRNRFRVSLVLKKKSRRITVVLRAVDEAGQRSRPVKVRIQRRR